MTVFGALAAAGSVGTRCGFAPLKLVAVAVVLDAVIGMARHWRGPLRQRSWPSSPAWCCCFCPRPAWFSRLPRRCRAARVAPVPLGAAPRTSRPCRCRWGGGPEQSRWRPSPYYCWSPTAVPGLGPSSSWPTPCTGPERSYSGWWARGLPLMQTETVHLVSRTRSLRATARPSPSQPAVHLRHLSGPGRRRFPERLSPPSPCPARILILLGCPSPSGTRVRSTRGFRRRWRVNATSSACWAPLIDPSRPGGHLGGGRGFAAASSSPYLPGTTWLVVCRHGRVRCSACDTTNTGGTYASYSRQSRAPAAPAERGGAARIPRPPARRRAPEPEREDQGGEQALGPPLGRELCDHRCRRDAEDGSDYRRGPSEPAPARGDRRPAAPSGGTPHPRADQADRRHQSGPAAGDGNNPQIRMSVVRSTASRRTPQRGPGQQEQTTGQRPRRCEDRDRQAIARPSARCAIAPVSCLLAADQCPRQRGDGGPNTPVIDPSSSTSPAVSGPRSTKARVGRTSTTRLTTSAAPSATTTTRPTRDVRRSLDGDQDGTDRDRQCHQVPGDRDRRLAEETDTDEQGLGDTDDARRRGNTPIPTSALQQSHDGDQDAQCAGPRHGRGGCFRR